jgi:hypothetical protein
VVKGNPEELKGTYSGNIGIAEVNRPYLISDLEVFSFS